MVTIEGDSHARHLTGMIQQRLSSAIRVTGMCKPGARLLDVISDGLLPPESCCVLLAGTNDIAAGEAGNIYRHLEQRVTARLSSARVVLSTIPHRHDLPPRHPVNQQTFLVNNYIKELSERQQGLVILDINTIGRRWFTRHGLHLRKPGKELLAGLIVKSLMAADRTSDADLPPLLNHLPTSLISTACREPSATLCQPITLPHDTYADALKVSSSSNAVEASTISFNNSVFLGRVKRG